MTNSELKFGEWADYAEEDLIMAELALQENGPPNQICYHSQQAAEKYLKGLLVFHKKKFEKSHQLSYLLELCEDVDPSLKELREDAIYLTQFYIETRYPGDVPNFSRNEAQRAYEAAQRIKQFIVSKAL